MPNSLRRPRLLPMPSERNRRLPRALRSRQQRNQLRAQASNPPDPMAAIAAGGYFVQVAAVSKQEDAQALVDALKQKQYPAFVASNSATDKLFRVQMGPFGDIKEAEGMRSRLIDDGYNPILKK